MKAKGRKWKRKRLVSSSYVSLTYILLAVVGVFPTTSRAVIIIAICTVDVAIPGVGNDILEGVGRG